MLNGIRILDLSGYLPGPYATMLLGDLGAEVIKIEQPGIGDNMRHFTLQVDGNSLFFLAVNRNKKSITLNLKKEQGKEIFLSLVRESDVIIEGFRPKVMEGLGLDYEVVKKVNPGIVYCSLSGYGQNGSYRDRAGHDLNYLSVSGVLDMIKDRSGQPVIPGMQVADITGGMFAVIGILSALWQRQREGRGTHLDMSITDGLFSVISMHLMYYMATGTLEMLSGTLTCYNVYRTRDNDYVALAALEPKFWKNFCDALGRADLVPGHSSYAVEDDPTYQEVKNIFLSRNKAEWCDFSERVDCCLTPVNTADEVVNGVYARERGLIVDAPDVGDTLRQVLNPLVFLGEKNRKTSPPPALGQHNSVIYGDLGISEEELAMLKKDGVI